MLRLICCGFALIGLGLMPAFAQQERLPFPTLDAEPVCTDPVTTDFYNALEDHVGETVCVEGFVGYEQNSWVVAIPAATDAPGRSRRIALNAFTESTDLTQGDRIRVAGTLRRDTVCHDEDGVPVYGDDCWRLPTALFIEQIDWAVSERSIEVEGCRDVDFEQLVDDPLAYSYQFICTDAFIRVEFEGMGLFPTFPLGPYQPALIGPGNTDWISDFDLRTGDLVHVEAMLVPLEMCVGPESFCIGGAPYWFDHGTLAFVERIPVRDMCEHIAIEDLYADPLPLDGQVICTEGVVSFQDGATVVGPEDTLIEQDTLVRMDVMNGYHYNAYVALVPGERVSVAGLLYVFEQCLSGDGGSSTSRGGGFIRDVPSCQPPLDLDTFELIVLEEIDPWSVCTEVDLADIYRNPLPFAEQMICGEGTLSGIRGEYDSIAMELTPPGTTVADLPWPEDDVAVIQRTEHAAIETPPVSVRFVARFSTWEECFQSGIPLEKDDPRPEPDDPAYDTPVCEPWFDFELYDVEFLEN